MASYPLLRRCWSPLAWLGFEAEEESDVLVATPLL